MPPIFKATDMIKRYYSKSSISINVVLSNNKSLHISFMPLSNGHSEYITENKDIQAAIEKHHANGKKFKLKNSQTTRKKTAAVPEKKTLQTIPVSDISAAKEYIADKYGVSRTLMKSPEDIIRIAKSKGIIFEGIE